MSSKIIPAIYAEVLANTSGAPVQDNALDVVGVVGTFARGPLQTPTAVSDPAEAALIFGDADSTQNSNFMTGMWALNLLMAQGAKRVVIVRIGDAETAELELLDSVSGAILNAAGTLDNNETAGAAVTIEVTPNPTTAGFAIGQKAIIDRDGANEEVVTLTAVGSATVTATIANSHLAGETIELVYQTGSNVVMLLQSNPIAAGFLVGQEVTINDGGANEETVSIEAISSTTITVDLANDHYADESVDQAAIVATVAAPSPGTFGNLYSVTVAAGTLSNTVKITVTGDGKQEVWDNLTNTPGTARYLVDFLNQNSVLLTVTAGPSPNLPAVLAATLLAGGTNGNVTSDSDYIGVATPAPTALYALDGQDVNILNCAGQSSAAVHSAMNVHAQTKADRIAVVGGAIAESVAATVSRAIVLSSDRVVMVFPGIKVFDPNINETVTLPSAYTASCVAGRVATLDPYRSPSNKQIIGILGMEKDINDADLSTLIQGGVNGVTLKNRLGFRIRSGITTSLSFPFNQVNIRRLFDQIVRGVTEGNIDLVSEPNNADTWHALEQGITDFLDRLKSQGAIQNFFVKVFSSPADQKAGFLYADVGIFPTYAADFIVIRIKPNDTGSFDASVVNQQ